MTRSQDINSGVWHFEAFITHVDGREYCQHARDNQDGTVTVLKFEPPAGFVQSTFPAGSVHLRERPWDKAKRWFDLFDKVYGSG